MLNYKIIMIKKILFIFFVLCTQIINSQSYEKCMLGFCLGSKLKDVNNITPDLGNDPKSAIQEYIYIGKEYKSFLDIPIHIIILTFEHGVLTNVIIHFKNIDSIEGITQSDFEKMKEYLFSQFGEDYTKRDISLHKCTLDEAIWDVRKDVLAILSRNNCQKNIPENEKDLNELDSMFLSLYHCEIVN